MRKLYIGCSLTHAPEEFKKKIEDLKAKLRADYEIMEFIGLNRGTPQDVYKWDIQNCVASADLFVAICDYPAIGLGYEMAAALEKYNKPTLGLAHKDIHVSRLVLGIDHPMYTFERYETEEDIIALIKRKGFMCF